MATGREESRSTRAAGKKRLSEDCEQPGWNVLIVAFVCGDAYQPGRFTEGLTEMFQHLQMRKLLTVCVLSCGLSSCTKEANRASASEPVSVMLRPDSAAEGVRILPDSPPAGSGADSARSPMNWSDSLDAIEVAGIAASGGKVSRNNFWDLRVQLLNGQTLDFKTDSTMSWGYRYVGHLQSIHSHVVHRVPSEDTGNYLIVDDSTGDSTEVLAVPIPSPDGMRFVLTSLGDDQESDLINISVWRMVGRTPEKEFSIDGANWRSSDAVWRDPNTIEFTKNTIRDRDDPSNYVKTPARLTRTGTTWVLSDSKNK